LKGLFVGLSLRIKDANAFLVRHARGVSIRFLGLLVWSKGYRAE
jgi:hypothetical protein